MYRNQIQKNTEEFWVCEFLNHNHISSYVCKMFTVILIKIKYKKNPHREPGRDWILTSIDLLFFDLNPPVGQLEKSDSNHLVDSCQDSIRQLCSHFNIFRLHSDQV